VRGRGGRLPVPRGTSYPRGELFSAYRAKLSPPQGLACVRHAATPAPACD
jgi:hypothetical protein